MRRDVDYLSQQVDVLKGDAPELLRLGQVEQMLKTVRSDLTILLNDKLSKLHKDLIIHIEQKLEILNHLPNKKEYVRVHDFSKFMEHFRNLRDAVDRVTDSLLVGYKAEANHALQSKIGRLEMDQKLTAKYDVRKGAELEKISSILDKNNKGIEKRLKTVEHSVDKVMKK